MTGEKNRYTTTEKLWDLDDTLLKTPAHDEMVLWLLNKDNVISLLTPIFDPKDPSVFLNLKNYKGTDFRYEDKSNFLKDLIRYEQPPENKYIEEIMGRWNELHIQCNMLLTVFKSSGRLGIDKIESKVPLTAKNGFLVGYTDIKITLSNTQIDYENFLIKVHGLPDVIYVEVKPTIKSFGETLRQLNTYRHYIGLNSGYFDKYDREWHDIPYELYLFTTDLRFKEAFESQGIKVLTYPD